MLKIRFKYVFFDLDGTITDTKEGIINSIFHSLKYYPSIKLPKQEELYSFIGPPLAASYEKFFGMDAQTARQAVEYYREYYRPTGVFECVLYDGIHRLLEDLHKIGAKIFLATSKPEIFAKKSLERFGISKYFEGIFGSTLDGSRVEKSDIIKYVISHIPDFQPSEAVMIGDTVYDIEGAKENSLKSIAVTYGYGKDEDLKSADYICSSASEIFDLLVLK